MTHRLRVTEAVAEWLVRLGVVPPDAVGKLKAAAAPHGPVDKSREDVPSVDDGWFVSNKDAKLLENGQHVQSILKIMNKGNESTAAASLLSATGPPARLHNWTALLPTLKRAGLVLDGATKALIVSGDHEVLSEFLLSVMQLHKATAAAKDDAVSGTPDKKKKKGSKQRGVGTAGDPPHTQPQSQRPHSLLATVPGPSGVFSPETSQSSNNKGGTSPVVFRSSSLKLLPGLTSAPSPVKGYRKKEKGAQYARSESVPLSNERKDKSPKDPVPVPKMGHVFKHAVTTVTTSLHTKYRNLFGVEPVEQWLQVSQKGGPEAEEEDDNPALRHCFQFISRQMATAYGVPVNSTANVLRTRGKAFVHMMSDVWPAVMWLQACVDHVDSIVDLLRGNAEAIGPLLNIFEICVTKGQTSVAEWACVFVTRVCERLMSTPEHAFRMKAWIDSALPTILLSQSAQRITSNIYDMLVVVLRVDLDHFLVHITDQGNRKCRFGRTSSLFFLLEFYSAISRLNKEDQAEICAVVSAEAVHHAEAVALAMFESDDLATCDADALSTIDLLDLSREASAPVCLLTELYTLFPHRLEVDESEATFVNVLASAVHAEQPLEYRVTAVACLFRLLEAHGHRPTFGQMLMDMATSLLHRAENYFLYEMVVSNLNHLLRHVIRYNSVVAAVTSVLSQRIVREQKAVDFVLLLTLARHPHLFIEDATLLIGTIASVMSADREHMSFAAIPSFVTIMSRFGYEFPFVTQLPAQVDRLVDALILFDAPSRHNTVAADAVQDLLVQTVRLGNPGVNAILQRILAQGYVRSLQTNRRESGVIRVVLRLLNPSELDRVQKQVSEFLVDDRPLWSMMTSRARVPTIAHIENFDKRRSGHSDLHLKSVVDTGSSLPTSPRVGAQAPQGDRSRPIMDDQEMKEFWTNKLLGHDDPSAHEAPTLAEEPSFNGGTVTDRNPSRDTLGLEPSFATMTSAGSKSNRTTLSNMVGGRQRSTVTSVQLSKQSVKDGVFQVKTADNMLLQVDARGRPIHTGG